MNRNGVVFLAFILSISFTSCKKAIQGVISSVNKANTINQFSKFTIAKGAQNADINGYKRVETSELNFVVRFDSSAIYQTSNPANQNDINKLFGFSDNNAEHLQYSARFGWNWGKEGLKLHAYVYNNGVRTTRLLGIVPVGADQQCSIKVTEGTYIFSLNGSTETLPRESTAPQALGYKLYPYFGGDEVAPHNITIYIKELQ
jgi:hypothetical protein